METELSALLDAHDALVAACAEASLAFAQFLAAYGDFPHNYSLGGKNATAEERDLSRLFARRIAFHSRVAGVLSGLRLDEDSANNPYGDAGQFASRIGLMRLRALVAQYPDFRAEPESIKS